MSHISFLAHSILAMNSAKKEEIRGLIIIELQYLFVGIQANLMIQSHSFIDYCLAQLMFSSERNITKVKNTFI